MFECAYCEFGNRPIFISSTLLGRRKRARWLRGAEAEGATQGLGGAVEADRAQLGASRHDGGSDDARSSRRQGAAVDGVSRGTSRRRGL
jgi:hypothetical protein